MHTPPALAAQACAESLGLRYIHADSPGIRRQRCGRGFAYYQANGRLLRDAAEKARIQALAIPPAWTEVWISPWPEAHLLATGRDAAGRKQYRYHPDWDAARCAENFGRLLAFGRCLSRLRARVDRDLRRPGLPRARVAALAVHLLDTTLIRVGNAAYARDNGSYGLTTLRREHVDLARSRVRLAFTGKAGNDIEVEIADARVARLMARCEELPGEPLFQYQDAQGAIRQLDSGDVNDYLRAATRADFTAKTFRTWGATVRCAEWLATQPPPLDAERQRAAIAHAADCLNNTPAVCRAHYVHPQVLEAADSGELHALWRHCRRGKLERAERLVLKLLQEPAAAAGRPLAQAA